MIKTLGDKLSMSHGLGQKAKKVASKVVKGGLIGGASALVLSGGVSQAMDAMKQAQRIHSSILG